MEFIERPLTTREICEYLKAAKTTIDQYNREGMPRFYVGKECRYIPSKVIDWLERRSLPRTFAKVIDVECKNVDLDLSK